MNSWHRRATLAALGLSPLLTALGRHAHGELVVHPPDKSVALVIGNSDYGAQRRLKTPANDAYAVSRRLEQLRFSVTTRVNLNFEGFQTALKAFARDSRTANTILFYYAGSGFTVDGMSYLVPIDALKPKEKKETNISIKDVFGSVTGAASLKLVIVDSCQDEAEQSDNTLTTLPSEIPRDTLLVYSTDPGHKAFDVLEAEDETSPFAAELIARMENGSFELRELFDQVRDGVRKRTRGLQQPFAISTLRGDTNYYLGRPQRSHVARGLAPIDQREVTR